MGGSRPSTALSAGHDERRRPAEGAAGALAPLPCLCCDFVVIARFWMIHRLAFRLIARDDAALVWLNLLLLMFVAFLPFPTAVLGAHAGSPAAAVLYATSVTWHQSPPPPPGTHPVAEGC